ncbi:hypothetical protein ACIA8C_07445 [Nocardia sp. NPDC051321]|uniref:hypothetical protein n=1 Tax=Nocardia sp. NPDC051321 TaxID=3364323 RepID=UPI0037888C85
MTRSSEVRLEAKEQFREIMVRLQATADMYLSTEAKRVAAATELARLTKELELDLDEADLVIEASQDVLMMAELQAFTDAFRAARDRHTTRDQRTDWMTEIRTLAEAYQMAEANGLPVQAISHAGWHPGARVGAHTAVANSILLAYHDSGDGAVLIFEEGHLDSFAGGGLGGDFADRPFTVNTVIESGLCGVLAPEAGKLEVISENGTVFAADVVAHTYAVTIDLPSERRLSQLRRAYAAPEDEVPFMFESDDRGENYETLDRFSARVYDRDNALLYTGPVLADQF